MTQYFPGISVRSRVQHLLQLPQSNVALFVQAMNEGKNLLIFDLEANTPGNEVEFDMNRDRIIQIGSVLVNFQFETVFTLSAYIHPDGPKLSPFITELTGITQEKVETEGMDFPSAYARFLDMYDPETTFVVSYGRYDMIHLLLESKRYNLPFPFLEDATDSTSWKLRHFNAKQLVNSVLQTDRKGLRHVMKHLELDSSGRAHDGLVDALDTLAVLERVFGSFTP